MAGVASSLSARMREWVELQSEMEESEMRVTELGGMTGSSLHMAWPGDVALRLAPRDAHWKMPLLFSS